MKSHLPVGWYKVPQTRCTVQVDFVLVIKDAELFSSSKNKLTVQWFLGICSPLSFQPWALVFHLNSLRLFWPCPVILILTVCRVKTSICKWSSLISISQKIEMLQTLFTEFYIIYRVLHKTVVHILYYLQYSLRGKILILTLSALFFSFYQTFSHCIPSAATATWFHILLPFLCIIIMSACFEKIY